MGMPGRMYSATSEYRYGFNGKEKDKDMHSVSAYDYGFRIYNAGIGRFLSVDPLFKSYPWYTPYQFAGNKPTACIDLDGLEEVEAISIRLTTGVYPKIQKQAAELVKSNPNQLAAMQQEAWNQVLVEIDALIPKYFDYKKNLQGIVLDEFNSEVENVVLNSKAAWYFNSLYNYDMDCYSEINPLLSEAASDLVKDHYRASLNSNEYYEKYINAINQAKDPNTKAALISERSSKSWDRIIAFQQACILTAEVMLEMYGLGRNSKSDPPAAPAPRYMKFSSATNSGLRFVKNESGELEDLQPTLDRIRDGVRYPHRNDGSVFRNDQNKLPQQPRGYYREYVHPTNGVNGPGRQRIVVGNGGEQYYTPNHYDSFIQLH